MVSEKRQEEIEVLRTESTDEDLLKVVFNFSLGEYPIMVKKEDYSLFVPGDTYKGIFEVSGMPDFIGNKDEWKNVCTISYNLEKVLNGEDVIWPR